MDGIGSDLRDFWRRLRAPPDALVLEMGAGGELLVAKLRAGLSLLLLLLPLINIATDEYTPTEGIAGVFGVILTVLAAQVLLMMARQKRRFRWLPWLTTSYDITLTSGVLVMLAVGSYAGALNSMIVWAFYLIAIGMTALRNDGRITLYAGGLAMLQYGLLAAVLFSMAHNPEQLASVDYGTARLSNVVQRLLLIAVTTVMMAVVVYRMQRLVELSGTDGLTGLANRTLLTFRFPTLADAAGESGLSLSVCLIDLDYFRRINDELGHAAGDRALQHVVDVLRSGLEDKDWLVRLGGEEFALVMPQPTGRAWERLEALRRSVAAQPFVPAPGEPSIRMTFSAGVSSWPQDG
ncbi:MAG: GGDEF domain-containing protein, partial [Thermomonas sp.]|uniref:GGDEF domain-containing protein n=1 Tax=Thermomonas sp. TaxID=1971895 RepID=UPI0026306D30